MRSSSEDSASEISEDEYEVEYLLGARWDGETWQYEVHWYGYPSDADTWEPEHNLTDYGSAGLVDRFWKEWPGKRNARHVVGTTFKASVDLMVKERRKFLANRPKNKPVKGVERLAKGSNKPILIGDPESEDDNDINASTEEEDDEDILRSSSSEDIPLHISARTKSSKAGTSTGAGTKARPRASSSAGKQPFATQRPVTTQKPTTTQKPSTQKPPASRPSVSHPVAPTPSVPTKKPTHPTPTVKATKISKVPVVQSRRGRKPMTREEMQAGSISKDFGGIGTKGKQVERAGEVMALGRRNSTSGGHVSSVALYAGLSMRKAGQASGTTAPSTSAGAGPSGTGSGTLATSPLNMSPIGLQQHQELPQPLNLEQSIDNLVTEIEATIQPEAASPPNSLFDGPSDDEREDQIVPMEREVHEPPDMPTMPEIQSFDPINVDDIDLGNLDMNSPPRPPALNFSIPPKPYPSAVTARHLDHFSPNSMLSPLGQAQAPPSPTPISPLQPGQWHWTGDLFVTVQESASGAEGEGENETAPKAIHHRVGEVVIRDPAIPNDNETKIFTNTLTTYVKGSITMQNTSDLHIIYSEFGAGVFEPTQAAWMLRSDADVGGDPDLWRGLLRKMESTFQGTIIKIYTANGVQMGRHLLIVPCTLMRKFCRLQSFFPMVEHFKSRGEGFAVILCKRLLKADEPDPRPLLAYKLPQHWQEIPPKFYPQLRNVKCLIFPRKEFDSEAGLLHTELVKCKAVVLDGVDPKGEAAAIFVHRAWVWQLSGLRGLTHRRKRTFRRFYLYGSGGLWRAGEWDIREIWLIGGMVTFTPAALLEDPWVIKKVLEVVKDNPTWHAYIEPQAIGLATLCTPDDEVSFVLERILEEISLSDDFAPYPLALTSPPRRGFTEELEWIDIQYARTGRTAEDLRKMCEDEVIEAYKKEAEITKEKEEKQAEGKQKGPDSNDQGWSAGGGWGAPDGGTADGNGNNGFNDGWGDPTTNQSSGWGSTAGGWGSDSAQANGSARGSDSAIRNTNGWGSPAHQPLQIADDIKLSEVTSRKRIQDLSDGVIEGLKTMQIQPCFMREIRRFIVIDSKARVEGNAIDPNKIEVEVITADTFISEFGPIR